MTEILGRDVPQPVAWRSTDWRGSRFTRGAYSTVPVGSGLAELDTWRSPSAAASCSPARPRARAPGYSDGAMTSGIREAKRLLQRPSVVLGAG